MRWQANKLGPTLPMCHSAAIQFNNLVVSAGNCRTSAALSWSPLRRFAQAPERARPRAQQRENPYSCTVVSINNRRAFWLFLTWATRPCTVSPVRRPVTQALFIIHHSYFIIAPHPSVPSCSKSPPISVCFVYSVVKIPFLCSLRSLWLGKPVRLTTKSLRKKTKQTLRFYCMVTA